MWFIIEGNVDEFDREMRGRKALKLELSDTTGRARTAMAILAEIRGDYKMGHVSTVMAFYRSRFGIEKGSGRRIGGIIRGGIEG